MAATISAPIVTGALAVGGAAMTLAYTWDLGQRLSQDRNLQNSLNDLWRNGDSKTYNSTRPIIENSLGGESFNLAVGLLSAGAGARATKLAAEMIGPTNAKTNLRLAGAPVAVTENAMPSGKIPDNAFAMVWHRDRLGYEWDKIDPKTLESYIKKASLSERLSTIESAIDKGELYKAYDHAGANLKWHDERSGSHDDEHGRLSRQFYNIGILTRNAWDEPGKLWLDKARAEIKLTRERFPDKPGWPPNLKVEPDNLADLKRLASTPLSKRVEEIQALANSGMFKDAATLANVNHILHRNAQSKYGENKFNDTRPYYHQDISECFDRLFLHLHRMFDENLEDLVPETSAAKINEQLAALKKM
jgi:hypothetical protein